MIVLSLIGDKLYFSYHDPVNDVHYFDIYYLESQQATLISHNLVATGYGPAVFNIVENKAFFTQVASDNTTIHDLDNAIKYFSENIVILSVF